MAGRGNILIIEDDALAREFLNQYYGHLGCRIVMAENGRESLDKMAEGPYDIIFLDLNMPVMGGLEALPHLRDKDQNVHIVITTAFASYESKLEARKHGVYDYLVKPVTLAKLKEIAEKYLTQKTEPHDLTDEGLAMVGIDLDHIDPQIGHLIPEQLARTHFLIAVSLHRNTLTVAITDPNDTNIVERLNKETGYEILTLQAERQDILQAIGKVYSEPVVRDQTSKTKLESRAPLVNKPIVPTTTETSRPLEETIRPAEGEIRDRLTAILSRAQERQALEIHLDPLEDRAIVRLRVHGRLESFGDLPISDYYKLIHSIRGSHRQRETDSELRLQSRTNRRTSRDQIYFRSGDRSFLYSYHILPSLYGDSVFIYLHDQEASPPDISKLGIDPSDQQTLLDILRKQTGMVILTGLPGHGQMTTCYAALHQIMTSDHKIVVLGNAFSQPITGITQVPIRTEVGQTYATALREILLHNPDVIAIEETPDRETTSLALHAAAGGRLVVSTMFAADAVACLSALVKMEMEPLMVSRTVSLVLAQYRLKRICPYCKTSTEPSETMRQRLTDLPISDIPETWFFGSGCERCGMTGFRGYTTIYEALPVTSSLQRLILEHASTDQLRQAAALTSYKSLSHAGFEKVANGQTTVDEVLQTLPLYLHGQTEASP